MNVLRLGTGSYPPPRACVCCASRELPMILVEGEAWRSRSHLVFRYRGW